MRFEARGQTTHGALKCITIAQAAKLFFPKALGAMISRLMLATVDTFGAQYQMDLLSFLEYVVPHLGEERGTHASVRQGTYLKRIDSSELLNSSNEHVAKGGCGNCLSVLKRCRSHHLWSNFELWGRSIRHVQATHGGNIANYFSFARWIFLLNLVLLMVIAALIVVPYLAMHIPPNFDKAGDWREMLVGRGLQGYMVFYGDYDYQAILDHNNITILSNITNSTTASDTLPFVYPLDVAWVLFEFLLISIVLLLIIQHMGAGREEDTVTLLNLLTPLTL
jgi:hypothetical protein